MTGKTKAPSGGDPAAADRRREVRRTSLYLGLMVAGAAAVWGAGELLRGHLVSSRRPDRSGEARPGPAGEPKRTPRNAADPEDVSLSAVGLEPMDADPGQVAAPAGARRRFAFRRRYEGQLEQQARYEFDGPADEAVKHYRQAFARQGLSLVSDRTAPTGRRALVFEKGPAYACVALRKNPGQARVVIIVVTVAGPAPSGTGAKR